MLYHKCSGAACLNHELASLAKLVGSEVTTHLTGLRIKDFTKVESEGLGAEVLVNEASRAKALLGSKAVPIMQLSDLGLQVSKELTWSAKIAFLV